MWQRQMNMFGMTNTSARPNDYTASSLDVLDTNTMSWTAIIGYTVTILLILFIILLFVNYTITPIFQIQPGGPGIIRLPFSNPSQNYWPPAKVGIEVPTIVDTPVNNSRMATNWSMSLDICITEPLMPILTGPATDLKPGFRLLFNRGGSAPATLGTDGTITSILTGYNLAIGLLKDTNDLVVSVINGVLNPENILIHNVPTQKPFRIGVIVMDSAFEVYINGKLFKTRKVVSSIPQLNSGIPPPPFEGPKESVNQMARVGNLILWTSVIEPSVMKYATPTLMQSLSSDTLSAGSMCGGDPSTGLLGSLTSGLVGLATQGEASIAKLGKSMNTEAIQNAISTLGTQASSASSILSNNALNNP